MHKTNIEGFDYCFNPVIGCKRKGYNIHKNYRNFTPQLVERNLYTKFPKKPSKIFVNSMSDIEYWEDEWFELVFKRIRENPQHKYFFLTKEYKVYHKRMSYFVNYDNKIKLFMGLTCTDKHIGEVALMCHYKENMNQRIWVSFEPLYQNIIIDKETIKYFKKLNYVVIGKMTGIHANKYPCKQEWIDNIVNECKKYNIRYLVKGE